MPMVKWDHPFGMSLEEKKKKKKDMAQVNLLPKVRRKLKKTKTRKDNCVFRPTF